ncbi:peroxiredoxin [Methylophaga sp.]|uniref:peroxiredoxin n=1 Tax=Methylophaga sp. TaxID=2024840 RepID=UPI0013FFCCD3|nr:peroxiredoxin [Methylophaga sp.]MTI63912.1 peroxiredoxin [Methylophaga sp.]
MTTLEVLPSNLPIPIDDGACRHLSGLHLPDIRLLASNGQMLNLSLLCGPTVVFVYPMTGHPARPLPFDWNQIPGARGCTTQACSFRDNIEMFAELGVRVFGLSNQTNSEQQKAVARLQLPYRLLSDENLLFTRALALPLFESGGGVRRIKRLTLICRSGIIEQCLYPVFPPDAHATQVLALLTGSSPQTG